MGNEEKDLLEEVKKRIREKYLDGLDYNQLVGLMGKLGNPYMFMGEQGFPYIEDEWFVTKILDKAISGYNEHELYAEADALEKVKKEILKEREEEV